MNMKPEVGHGPGDGKERAPRVERSAPKGEVPREHVASASSRDAAQKKKGFFRNLGDLAQSMATKFGDALGYGAEAAADDLKDLGRNVKKVAEAPANFTEKALRKTAKGTAKVMDLAASVAESLAENAVKLPKDAPRDIKNVAKDLYGKYDDGMEKVGEFVVPRVKAAGKLAVETAMVVPRAVAGTAKLAGFVAGEAAPVLAAPFEIMTDLSEMAVRGGAKAMEGVSDFSAGTVRAAKDLTLGTGEMVGNMAEDGVNFAKDLPKKGRAADRAAMKAAENVGHFAGRSAEKIAMRTEGAMKSGAESLRALDRKVFGLPKAVGDALRRLDTMVLSRISPRERKVVEKAKISLEAGAVKAGDAYAARGAAVDAAQDVLERNAIDVLPGEIFEDYTQRMSSLVAALENLDKLEDADTEESELKTPSWEEDDETEEDERTQGSIAAK